ncbi:hypothetical protein CDD80_408 [Ophiocordyceps camponoti-rufipedis]|uniref:Myb-like domain-containing protein n=1 Tax=Ophiocordyceps camponoti-rufipedis TaxID=2004952 RepID=A0A2C5YKX1_9HYPO|nr:hypothetical protein CDD80_408 [Ophiocordyceps camponoti-rufipedis]
MWTILVRSQPSTSYQPSPSQLPPPPPLPPASAHAHHHHQPQNPYQHHHHHHHHQTSPVQQPSQPQQTPTKQRQSPQHPPTVHLPGVCPTASARTAEPSSHGHLPSLAMGGVMSQKQAEQGPMPQASLESLQGHRLGHVPFGAASNVSTPLYGAVSSPNQSPYASYSAPPGKRSRPDDFDLTVAVVDAATGLEGVATGYGSEPTQMHHHHHHLPDLGPPSKTMRRDETGGAAPSMVGQVGMPAPAARPRGPKLKFTAEDDQLLIELKEQKNLTWKQIADFFPGRSSGTLQVRYCTKLKAKTTLWTDDMDQKLRKSLQDYENEKWRIVAHKVGSGFTPAACRERAGQLVGEEPEQLWQSLSPKAASLPESMELSHSQRPW